MSYPDLFREEHVLLNTPAGDAGSVLSALADVVVKGNAELEGREAEILAALETREAQGSTGSQGVAIPHVKVAGLTSVSIALLVNRDGVDFRALDGEAVNVFFGVLRPEEKAEEHLGLLRWIASVAQHEDFVSFACQADSPAQVLELLHELTTA
jgi:mannitol/fructose-specific phosphotransferase system IIA component (Ntr-type)